MNLDMGSLEMLSEGKIILVSSRLAVGYMVVASKVIPTVGTVQPSPKVVTTCHSDLQSQFFVARDVVYCRSVRPGPP